MSITVIIVFRIVRSHSVARRQFHGLHEHRDILVATRGQPGPADGKRRDAIASGCQGQSDRHHTDIAPQRSSSGRQG